MVADGGPVIAGTARREPAAPKYTEARAREGAVAGVVEAGWFPSRPEMEPVSSSLIRRRAGEDDPSLGLP